MAEKWLLRFVSFYIDRPFSIISIVKPLYAMFPVVIEGFGFVFIVDLVIGRTADGRSDVIFECLVKVNGAAEPTLSVVQLAAGFESAKRIR